MKYALILFGFTFLFSSDVLAQDCPDDCEVFIPNNVTPNCDGIDCHFLKIITECEFLEFEFIVFSRWGQKVFESNDSEVEFSSKEVDEGTYFWTLEATFCNESEIEKDGYVNVIK